MVCATTYIFFHTEPGLNGSKSLLWPNCYEPISLFMRSNLFLLYGRLLDYSSFWHAGSLWLYHLFYSSMVRSRQLMPHPCSHLYIFIGFSPLYLERVVGSVHSSFGACHQRRHFEPVGVDWLMQFIIGDFLRAVNNLYFIWMGTDLDGETILDHSWSLRKLFTPELDE